MERGNRLNDRVHDLIAGDAVGKGLEREQDAVAKHFMCEGFDVFRNHIVAALHQRVGLSDASQRDGRAWRGSETH